MKQAFLVIAHNNPEILCHQLAMLDNANTAIYLHIDKRANIDRATLREVVKQSYLEFIPSRKIRWGQYSQIDCELRLLRAALKRGYDYYHLISGVDLPLHTVNEMEERLKANPGCEYIHFDAETADCTVIDRVRYYHLFVGRSSWQKRLDGVLVWVQRLLGLDRWRKTGLVLQKGANWFSITDSLARSIAADAAQIRHLFAWSRCGDELFLQTYVYNSAFRERLVKRPFDNDYAMCLRKIDWDRGTPYVFRQEDYEELIASSCLFARKFDWSIDPKIVRKLYKRLKEKDESGCEWFEPQE